MNTERDEPLHPDVNLLTRAVQSHDDAVVALQAAIEDLTERLSSHNLTRAFAMAARETLQDEELVLIFVREIYSGFVEHGKTDSAMWLGSKITAWFSSAMVGLAMFLLWEFGIKK